MSAIFGILNLTGEAVSPHTIKRMSGALKAHGPERDSHWTRGPVMLGHRLQAFTPEDRLGQGIENSGSGRYRLTAEGRIDNRDELIVQLGLDARETALWPDSRIMLKAFERWGDTAGSYLYGDFCFAVWDSQTESLHLVRDPLGYHHSLFYYSCDNFIAFSTAIKGLLAVPGIPRELNEEKLADFLILNHKNHRTTHYRDIHRLPPAHSCTCERRSGKHVLNRYWQPDLDKRIHFADEQDYVAAFNELFERCVADNLRSITEVGAFMSGGIDSSAVATTAALQLREQQKELHTYTAVPRDGFDGDAVRGWYNDETPLVNAIAAMHDNLVTHFITADGETPLDNLDSYFDANEAPFRNPCNRVWMEAIMREGQSRNQRVMLTGQHGNMTLSWEGTWALPDWLRRGRWMRFARGLNTLAGYRDASGYRYFRRAVSTVLPDTLWQGIQRVRHSGKQSQIARSSGINPEFAQSQRVFERAAEVGFSPAYRLPPDGRAARWKVLEGIDFSGDLATGYRAAFGVERRDPTGDRRLIEYCLAIPQTQFLGNGEHRRLAKRALADRLPREVLHNNLRGAQDPGWYERLQGAREQLAESVAQMRDYPETSQVLNLGKLQNALDNWPDDDAEWNTRTRVQDYRLCLNRGVMVGAFVNWFEGRNR